MAKREFKYKPRSAEDVRERANQQSGNFDRFMPDNVKMFKPRDGKNIIRVLPPTWDGAKHFGYELWVVYGVGADNQSYLSPSKMRQEDDPIEEMRRELTEDRNEKAAKSLTPKKRVGIYLIDRMAEDEGVQFWAMPWTLDRDIANRCYDEDTKDVIMIDDPDNGADVRFYKEGTGRNTEYNAARITVLKDSPLSDDKRTMNDWLAYVEDNPIPEKLVYYPYDHLKRVVAGTATKKPDEDDADVLGRGRASREEERGRGGRGGREEERGRGTRDRGDERGGRSREPEPNPEEDRGTQRGGRGGRDDPRDDDRRGGGERSRARPRLDEPDNDSEPEPEPEDRGRGRTRREEPERGRDRDDRGSDRGEERGGSERSRTRARLEDDPADDDRGGGRERSRSRDDDRGEDRGGRRERSRAEPEETEREARDDDRRGGRDRDRDREDDRGGGKGGSVLDRMRARRRDPAD